MACEGARRERRGNRNTDDGHPHYGVPRVRVTRILTHQSLIAHSRAGKWPELDHCARRRSAVEVAHDREYPAMVGFGGLKVGLVKMLSCFPTALGLMFGPAATPSWTR